MSSISKISSIKFAIIRRSQSARSNSESISETEISNKEEKLDNKSFNDLIYEKNDSKKDKQDKEKNKSTDKDASNKNKTDTKNADGITDFYA